MLRENYNSYYEKNQLYMEVIGMKEFWTDYKELFVNTLMFYGKHWKGCIALNVAVGGAMYIGAKGVILIQEKLDERRFNQEMES